MAAWSGFTDEDLRRMKKNSQEDERKPRVKRIARQPNKVAAQRHGVNASESPPTENLGTSQLPAKAQLAQQRAKVEQSQAETGRDRDINNEKADKTVEANHGKVPPNDVKKPTVQEVTELDEEKGLSVEKENAIKFQQQQKVIEEANKQKKALLSKAIEERRKKAKAESAKLIKIQRELSQMDTLLNVDVGIIRDRIEAASLDYVQAQKRYEKAEKEFIEAKMDLYEKGESKEQLTEHLYTIIHQNEMRKAKKLVELMEQLAMEVSAEEMEVAIPSIPPLTNFNAVTTLHQPGHRSKSESEGGGRINDGDGKGGRKEGVDDDSSVGKESAVQSANGVDGAPSSTSSVSSVVCEPDAAASLSSMSSPRVVAESQAVGSSQASGVHDKVGVLHEEKGRKDANQNNLSKENFGKDADQTPPSVEKAENVVVSDQSLSSSSSSAAIQVKEQSGEKSLTSSDSGTCSPAVSVTKTSVPATHPSCSPSSPSSTEQSQPQEQPPLEEKPVKGWSLPFMQ